MPNCSCGSPADPIPFALFRQRLLSLYSPPLRARATYLGMRRALDTFAALPGVASTADLTPDRLAAWVQDRTAAGLAVNTVISGLSCLRAAANHARAEGWLARDPFASRRLRLRREPAAGRAYYGIGEVARLLAYLEEHAGTWRGARLFALVALVAYTGLRKMEALHLEVGDVDLAGGTVAVSARRRLKTADAAGLVPLPPELVPVLAAWLPQAGPTWAFPGRERRGPWTGGMPGYRPLDGLRRAGAAVGLPGVTFHALRHTLATHMAGSWGCSLEQVRQVLRHTSATTTLRHYVHRDPESLARSAGRVSYRPGP